MIRDNDPLTNRYISVPRDYGPLNCAAFIGGILRGALDSAGFVRCLSFCGFAPGVTVISLCSLQSCAVTTHTVAVGDGEQTVFVIEFAPEALTRDF